ncbi:hypothetical protein P8452_18536 [Trifolium repens]|nr:hypothetical protein P8452_18536 [Trifolium repens]
MKTTNSAQQENEREVRTQNSVITFYWETIDHIIEVKGLLLLSMDLMSSSSEIGPLPVVVSSEPLAVVDSFGPLAVVDSSETLSPISCIHGL